MGLTTSEMSAADIAAVTGGNGNGFGNGDGAWWIIILFLFAFMGNWGTMVEIMVDMAMVYNRDLTKLQL